MPINWKKIIIVSSGTIVIGSALVMNLLYRDLYRRFPMYDRKIIRKAYLRALYKGYSGQYKSDLSEDELYMFILDQVEEVSNSS